MRRCDIIIPSYNSAATIPHTVAALFAQRIPASWQPRLIVSDDGSHDETLQRLKKIQTPAHWLPTIVVSAEHSGVAVARNRGLSSSNADVVILLGADIIMRPQALEQHLNFHYYNPEPHSAALGMVKWDPRCRPTPLMEWMIHGGPQNDFDALLGNATADPRHYFYASHISVKRLFLGHNPFPTIYKNYGWEDVDCGRALAKRGLILFVLHNAIALHRHNYSVGAFALRQYEVGRGLVIYQHRHQDVALLPRQRPIKRYLWQATTLLGILYVARLVLALTASQYATPYFFARYAAGELWRGVRAAVKTERSTQDVHM